MGYVCVLPKQVMMLLCLAADVHLAKKETLRQFQAFREARLSVIRGETLTTTISVKVNYEFTNWNWQIDLCFYLSKNPSVNRAPAPAAPGKQTSAGRRGRLCVHAIGVCGVSAVIMWGRLITGCALPR